MSRLIDMTRQQFSDWSVVSRAENNKNGSARWNCRCVCGNESVVLGTHLRRGNSTGCGCERIKKLKAVNTKDEIGNRYYKLLVIGRDMDPPRTDRAGVYWICECDCGNTTSIFGDYLRNGDTGSCGCVISKGEAKIAKILSENGIKFKTQQTFTDLVSEKNYLSRFDFGVYKNGELSHLIEFDGIQHFQSSPCASSWNTPSNLEVTKKRDKLKDVYCQEKGIRLIRIRYDKEFGLEDLV